MKKSLMVLAFLISAAASAQAGTKYCKDVGSGTLEINGTNMSITTQGLGETDGVLNFVNMKKRELPPEWPAIYSDYLHVPVASGVAYEGKGNANGNLFPAKIYVLDTEPDTRGRVQQILMVSLAGSPPDLVGVDANCK